MSAGLPQRLHLLLRRGDAPPDGVERRRQLPRLRHSLGLRRLRRRRGAAALRRRGAPRGRHAEELHQPQRVGDLLALEHVLRVEEVDRHPELPADRVDDPLQPRDFVLAALGPVADELRREAGGGLYRASDVEDELRWRPGQELRGGLARLRAEALPADELAQERLRTLRRVCHVLRRVVSQRLRRHAVGHRGQRGVGHQSAECLGLLDAISGELEDDVARVTHLDRRALGQLVVLLLDLLVHEGHHPVRLLQSVGLARLRLAIFRLVTPILPELVELEVRRADGVDELGGRGDALRLELQQLLPGLAQLVQLQRAPVEARGGEAPILGLCSLAPELDILVERVLEDEHQGALLL
mmetsp:Transcript_115552/g.299556  ORF Transcript_115552/g.299556 Transcript_115552/m.299556 type:complete len:355 (-) Transcript_115552:1597-2661(-)